MNKEQQAAERTAAIEYAHANLSSSAYWLFCDLLRASEDHSPANIQRLIVQAAKESADV